MALIYLYGVRAHYLSFGSLKVPQRLRSLFTRLPSARLVVEDAILLLQIILSTCSIKIFSN